MVWGPLGQLLACPVDNPALVEGADLKQEEAMLTLIVQLQF